MKSITLRGSQLVLALVAAGVIGGAGVQLVGTQAVRAASSLPTVSASAPALATTASPVLMAPDFSSIVARHGAAVVNISVVGKVAAHGESDSGGSAAQGVPNLSPDDPFFEFFRRFGPPGSAGGDGAPAQPQRGQGSGFIISADGVILTNAHVVRDASEVTVKLTDRREFVAKVLGSDPLTDVAVLKIAAKDLPVLSLGGARDLKVGEWVLAIGSPFGLESSVSAGVVSAKGRSLPDDSMVPFIQTDVAVNPGNSGGPLFNTRGEVVGINSQIYSRTGGYQGLSFAIPMETVLKVKDQILATGKASHARLGVAVQDVNQTLADSFQLKKPQGALVSSVEAGGPADKAGLMVGDVVLQVNDKALAESGDLPALIGQALPGETMHLAIWRQGKPAQLSVQLGNANDKLAVASKPDPAMSKGRLGLALRPLDPAEQRASGLLAGGLVVERVQQGPAALAGVQQGDVLLAINGAKVKTVAQVQTAMTHAGKSIALLIQRQGDQIFVPIRLG